LLFRDVRRSTPLLAPSALRAIFTAVIRIAISAAAFDAIARTMPIGSVGFENQADAEGNRLIWLPHDVLAKLHALRGRGQSYSGVILRVATR
jgi:hypothetical protein